MTVNELMVGDWMHSKSNHVDSKVSYIKCGTHNVVLLKRCWQPHYMDEIEPIQLTEEILEANGIKYQNGMPWYQGGYEGEFELHYSNRDVVGIGDLKTDITLTCRYIHELQHLLRMCGIDKEIVL